MNDATLAGHVRNMTLAEVIATQALVMPQRKQPMHFFWYARAEPVVVESPDFRLHSFLSYLTYKELSATTLALVQRISDHRPATLLAPDHDRFTWPMVLWDTLSTAVLTNRTSLVAKLCTLVQQDTSSFPKGLHHRLYWAARLGYHSITK
ncbi:hypothetical protein H4R34_005756, partial [Dimargaris verticillata]